PADVSIGKVAHERSHRTAPASTVSAMSRNLPGGISTAGRISKSFHQHDCAVHSRGTADSERISQRAIHFLEAQCRRQYLANVSEEIPQRQKCLLVRSEGGSRSCRLVSSDDGFNSHEISRYRARD